MPIRTKEKGNGCKKTKPEVTRPTIFFFVKHKEGLAGGTTAAKTFPPLGDRSGVADTRASDEAGAEAAEELGIGSAEELGIGSVEELGTKELNTGASEEAGVETSEELVPDARLLQKDQD